MNPSIDFDERLRVRTLGFHLPRPGSRTSTRYQRPAEPTWAEVAEQVRSTPDPAPLRGFSMCVSRRRVVLAELADGRHVLIKWPDDGLDQDTGHELRMLGLMAELPLPRPTRAAIPRVLTDPDRRISVYEAIDPCESMRELSDRGGLTTAHIVALAGVLAGLHTTPVDDLAAANPDLRVPMPAPKNTLLSVREYSYGLGMEYDEWLRVIQSLSGHWAALHRTWQPRSLLHFDLRDDNVLFATGDLRVIDWEFACLGDPAYDVGHLITQFVLPAVRRWQPGSPLMPPEVLGRIGTFLTAYLRFSGYGTELPATAVRYAGLVLLQHAGAQLEQFGSLDRTGHLALVLAEGLVRKPETLLKNLHLDLPESS
ncbi:aminoglycoside phosphotransferase family protein [Amycolatopsis alba]|uniref:Aminoglycoside phosphotransferase domain-containing protein n=1 Tax=Amycolatopsis alba DSM 44262 TaxID=1125972 RepID=A0A229SA91_AMYAL|nr:aminoglycoside phosphotransferase family protein [Amycolatopsis alba]OXM55619.1 hypothetical protein CFP75_00740 [Amycolatopsis alba DSM 44262]